MEEKNALLFEDYLQNALSEKERLSLENRLKEDAAFAQEFTLYKNINGFLENRFSKERKALKNTLKNQRKNSLATQTENKQVKVLKLNRWYIGIAASILLLVGIYFVNLNNSISYSDYAFSNTIALVERNSDNTLLKSAETAFNTKNYKEALGYFTQILKENPNNNQILFYKGIALVETNNFTAAELVFTKLQQSQSIYKNKALFYLALSKLKQKDYDGCKRILETLPETAEDYKKAQEILEKLNT